MQSLYFNEAFFYSLPRAFGERQKDFSHRVLGFTQSMAQWKHRGRTYTVRDIIRISNGTRIPMCYFLSTKQQGEVHANPKRLVVPQEQWHEVTFDLQAIRQLYKNGGTDNDKTLRSTIADILGVTPFGVWHWLTDGGDKSAGGIRFTADFDRMMQLCDRFSLPLSMFVRDLNAPIPFVLNGAIVSDGDMNDMRDTQRKLINTTRRCQKLQSENVELRKKLIANHSVAEPATTYGITRFAWRSSEWQGDEIPTVRELVRHCRDNRKHLSDFIAGDCKPVAQATPSSVLISADPFSVCSAIHGKVISPDMRISQFCQFLNDTNLTPSIFFVGTGDSYERTFADKALALIVSNQELLQI